jgi:hypothetical protein
VEAKGGVSNMENGKMVLFFYEYSGSFSKIFKDYESAYESACNRVLSGEDYDDYSNSAIANICRIENETITPIISLYRELEWGIIKIINDRDQELAYYVKNIDGSFESVGKEFYEDYVANERREFHEKSKIEIINFEELDGVVQKITISCAAELFKNCKKYPQYKSDY